MVIYQVALEETPSFVAVPGDGVSWTVRLNEKEQKLFEGSTEVRLDIIGDVNMAAFYALNVFGWVKSRNNTDDDCTLLTTVETQVLADMADAGGDTDGSGIVDTTNYADDFDTASEL